jgi:hypothetical protein
MRPVHEREGAEKLSEIFNRAGCSIEMNVPFVLDAGTVTLDGWDANKKIGFEFITTEAGDRAEFTASVIAEIETRMDRGELYLFLLDEALVPRPESLERAANRFLELLKSRGVLP